jgi:ubiquinone/menaquinone biosynthesis C-methylase UbiE
MKQNIYDNEVFFEGYKKLRENKYSLNEAIEHPTMLSLLPSIKNKIILDLGCGFGDFSLKLSKQGALEVIGVDISSNMIKVAESKVSGENVQFIKRAIEDFDFESEKFDIVVSSLTFHYILDLNRLFADIYSCLKKCGYLVFSIEHPMMTAAQGNLPGWSRDEKGNKVAW